jgi:hypothetical protein
MGPVTADRDMAGRDINNQRVENQYLVTVPDAPERIDMDARAVLKDRSAAWSR